MSTAYLSAPHPTSASPRASGTLGTVTYALLRIGAGLLFMEHGAQKLFGLLGGFGAPGATAELFSLMGLAGVLEFFGGLLIVLGLFTRPVAAVLLLQMLVAFGMVHLPQGGAPVQNGGELALLYGVVYAFLAGHGAGPASLDARIAGRRESRTAA